MNLTEYARHRSVHLSTVQDAIKYERIFVTMYNGRKMIEQIQADKDWEENTRHEQARYGPRDVASPKELKASQSSAPTYNQSKALREAFQAKLARLEFEEKSGKLVDKDKYDRQIFEASRRCRDHLLNIPARATGLIRSAKTDFEAEQILTKEIKAALKYILKDRDKSPQ